MDNGGYTGIVNWSLHPSLRPGPNQKNVMTINAEGDRLQLFANSTLVYEFIDSTYSRGLIGLMIGSGGTQNFQWRWSSVLGAALRRAYSITILLRSPLGCG
jgi:hypothetical protein